MKNFIKSLLICAIFVMSFSQDSMAGGIFSGYEEGDDKKPHRARVQPKVYNPFQPLSQSRGIFVFIGIPLYYAFHPFCCIYHHYMMQPAPKIDFEEHALRNEEGGNSLPKDQQKGNSVVISITPQEPQISLTANNSIVPVNNKGASSLETNTIPENIIPSGSLSNSSSLNNNNESEIGGVKPVIIENTHGNQNLENNSNSQINTIDIESVYSPKKTKKLERKVKPSSTHSSVSSGGESPSDSPRANSSVVNFNKGSGQKAEGYLKVFSLEEKKRNNKNENSGGRDKGSDSVDDGSDSVDDGSDSTDGEEKS